MIGAREIFKTLNSFDVRYVVIGGMAQTLQGAVIKTDDVDVCPDSATDNVARLADALTEMGAREWDPHKGEDVERLWDPEMLRSDRVWILRTRYGPLDVLFSPAGSGGYENLSADADVMDVAGLEVPVVSVDALIEMKEAAGRPKDREHLSFLYRLRRLRSDGEVAGASWDAELQDLRPTQEPEEL